MLDDKSQEEVNTLSRTSGIIVSALCGGIIIFGVIVVFFIPAGKNPTLNWLTYVSCGIGVLQTAMCLIVPRMIVHVNRKKIASGSWSMVSNQPAISTDAGKLACVYQLTTIIGCALLEGVAFFALIAYMLEANIIALIVAALMLVGVALHMPVGDRVTSWVESQLKIMDEEKQFSR